MLVKYGCTVYHASGDANFSIINNAILSSKNCNTTVVEEDTDLLILLLYHAKNYKIKLYFRSDIIRSSSKN